MSTLGDLTVPKIDQSGPPKVGEFTYIDISSIDNRLKRIVEPKHLPTSIAPSRAKQRLQPGDVLVSMTRPNLNTVAIVSPNLEGAVGSTGFHVLRAVDGIESRWLFYGVQTHDFVEAMSSLVQGALYPAVRPKDIRAFGIEAPPLDEQRLIVAEIEKQFSRLDEAVASLKRVRANLKRYKAAVLKAAVEGKLAPTTGPWKQVALGDVTTSIRNGYSKKPDAEQGTRIFRISAVRPMKLDANDVRYLSGTPVDYEPFLVEPGDVLFTRYNGNRDYVGVCARVPVNLPPTVYPDKLIRVRVRRLMMLSEFLVVLASTGHAREYIESKIRTTAGQSGISGGDLKVLPLDIPRVEEQLQIVAEVERRLSVVEKLEAAVQANLTRADRLRHSILNQAFSGRMVKERSNNHLSAIAT